MIPLKTKVIFLGLSGVGIFGMFVGLSGELKNEGDISAWGLGKIGGVVIACFSSGSAVLVGKKLIAQIEFDEEMELLQQEGRRELKGKEIRHRLAFAQKAQQLGFIEEITAFQEEFEVISPVLSEEVDESCEELEGTGEDFRRIFPESQDEAARKACSKALEAGFADEEVVKDVLGCSSNHMGMGLEYLRYLGFRTLEDS